VQRSGDHVARLHAHGSDSADTFEMVPRNPLLMAPVDLIGTTAITFVETGWSAGPSSFPDDGRRTRSDQLRRRALERRRGAALPVPGDHADGSLVSLRRRQPRASNWSFTSMAWAPPLRPWLPARLPPGGRSRTPFASIWISALTPAFPVRVWGGGDVSADVCRPGGGQIGMFQVNFQVPQPPASTPPCGGGVNSNLTVTIQGSQSFDGAMLCVATQ